MTPSDTRRFEVWSVPPTPFTESAEIDVDALDLLTDFYLDHGVDGLFLLALSGEGLEQSDQQRLTVARHVIERASGRARIAVGGNFSGTLEEQIEGINRLAERRPDAIVTFLSTLPRRDDLVEDLLTLAEHTGDVALGVYECPVPEHRLLSPGQVRQLAETGRFVFMKETSRDRQTHREKLAAARGTPLRVYQANLGQLPNSIVDGTAGFCGIIANVFPELVHAIGNDRELEESDRTSLLQRLSSILELMVARDYPASMKYLLSLRGVPIKTCSLMAGGESIDAERCRELEEAAETLGLLT